jgi:hypothetical protein
VLTVGANAAFVASTLGPLHKPRRVLETDHPHYIAMARAPLAGDEAARTPPFCYRVLTPLLAFGLTRAGLGVNASFWLITNASLVGFLCCLHRLLLQRGLDARGAALGVLLAGLTPGAVRWYEYQYWMTDPLCLFLIAAAMVLAEEGRERAVAGVSLLGIAARESYLLVFPWLLAKGARRDGLRTALATTTRVALPSLALFAGIRLLVPAAPGAPLAAVVADAAGFRFRHLLDNQLYLATLGSFGVLVPVLLASPARALAALRQRPEDAVLLGGAYASLLLGTNTERLLAYALPAVLTAALVCVRALQDQAGRWRALVGVTLLLAQAALYLQTPFHGIEGLSLYQPVSFAVVGLMALVWLLAVLLGRGVARRA